jgi:2,3-bisphosphoglycerate-independent phosphoglycerate mutase
MRIILVVGDGMADRPLKELDGRTPLEAAETPNLDSVAKAGVCGLMDIIAPGQPSGSDVANLALLGYDPIESYRGRGALEAMGAGIEIRGGDVAFRGNFSYVDDKGVVLDRRAGRIEGSQFKGHLSDVRLSAHPDVEVTVLPTLGHRLAIVLRGEKLSWKVSDTDPHKDGARILTSKPLEKTEEAERTAAIVNELTSSLRKMLRDDPVNRERIKGGLPPANAILLRGAGEPPAVTPMTDLYSIKGACVSATPTVRGACVSAGFGIFDAPGATGGVDTDTISKARKAEEVLPNHDIVYLHVKGTDNASHDGKAQLKVSVIEKIDDMVGHLIEHVDLDETYIAVTADHTTSVAAKDHRGDPVPVAISGPEVRSDAVASFSERACAYGGLGRIRGKELMPILLDLLGKMPLYGS